MYKGFLYCGLMVGESGEARVLEFNCRLDPNSVTHVVDERRLSTTFRGCV